MYAPSLIDGPWVLQYIYAQSFSTGTLSTIAPGPFGKNAIEVVWIWDNIVLFESSDDIFHASGVIRGISSGLHSVVRGLNQNISRVCFTISRDNIQKFDSFMKLKGIRAEISKKIHNFFELVWETEVKMNLQD